MNAIISGKNLITSHVTSIKDTIRVEEIKVPSVLCKLKHQGIEKFYLVIGPLVPPHHKHGVEDYLRAWIPRHVAPELAARCVGERPCTYSSLRQVIYPARDDDHIRMVEFRCEAVNVTQVIVRLLDTNMVPGGLEYVLWSGLDDGVG